MHSRHCALMLVSGALLLALSAEAIAHYCSNIYSAPAKFVVKAEKSTVVVSAGCPAKLRVYLQNNFPYKWYGVKLQGVASGYTVTTSPSGGQDISPGQNVGYMLTITGPSGSLPVYTTLSIQIQYYQGNIGTNSWNVNQNPTQAALIAAATSSFGGGTGNQTPSFSAAALADKYPSATLGSTTPWFNRTGVQQLIEWFGYRYCYDSGGGWNCGAQDCPSPCAEAEWSSPDDISQFPQDCMRAGAELAVRKAKLGGDLASAQAAATNALKGNGSGQHKCLAAVVGAYLVQGGSTTAFTSALTDAANGVPAGCQAAAQRILGSGITGNCNQSNYWEQAACAAAEGLVGNDGPVTSVLIANAGNGNQGGAAGGDYLSLYYAYMLYVVTGHRRGTCSTGAICGSGVVSYYPDAGSPSPDGLCGTPPDGPKPPPDQPKPPPDQAKPPVDQPKPPVDQPKPKVDQPKPTVDKPKPTVDRMPKDTRPPDHTVLVSDSGQIVVIDLAPPPPEPEMGPVADTSGSGQEKGRSNLDKLQGGCGCVVATEPPGGAPALVGLLALALLFLMRRRSS